MPSIEDACAVIQKLLLDLATEIDLHYDDDKLHVTKPSFAIIEEGIGFLRSAGQTPHTDVKKTMLRFQINSYDDKV